MFATGTINSKMQYALELLAKELLDKRSAIYSDRPQAALTMVKEMCVFDFTTTPIYFLISLSQNWMDKRPPISAIRRRLASTSQDFPPFFQCECCRSISAHTNYNFQENGTEPH